MPAKSQYGEPWTYNGDIARADGTRIAGTDTCDTFFPDDEEANRIVACINACAGVSNEALQKWIDHLKRCGPGDAEHLEQFFDESDTW